MLNTKIKRRNRRTPDLFKLTQNCENHEIAWFDIECTLLRNLNTKNSY